MASHRSEISHCFFGGARRMFASAAATALLRRATYVLCRRRYRPHTKSDATAPRMQRTIPPWRTSSICSRVIWFEARAECINVTHGFGETVARRSPGRELHSILCSTSSPPHDSSE